MNYRARFSIFVISLFTLSVQSQSITLQNTIPVFDGATELRSAWAGGIDAGQFSAMDLNGDANMDMVVFDRTDNSISTFINMGTPSTVDYVYDPSFTDSFPNDMYGWTLFRDFDNDGYEDIFTGSPTSKVKVYRNLKGDTGVLSWEVIKDRAKTNYPPLLELYSGKLDVPAIDDIDGDGDLDLLTFNILGGRVEWHKNISVDSGWGLDSVQFNLQSACFGHFDESPVTCSAIFADSACFPGQRPNPWTATESEIRAHAGSTILSLDLDNNGRKDLVIGDVGCNHVYALYQDDTSAFANFDTVDNAFPSYDVPVDINIFPSTFYLDVDNDGTEDLIAAPNLEGSDVQNQDGVWYYHNNGSTNLPDFEFQYTAFMQNEMMDVGSASASGFFDFDNDGLEDMVIGNYAIVHSAISKSTGLRLYLNTGTLSSPEFTLYEEDFLGLDTNGAFSAIAYYLPTFADLDGDLDKDLFLGEINGNIMYFENIAAPGDTAEFSFVTGAYDSINVVGMSAPTFFDFDDDDDLDLIVGNRKGYLRYYQNTGTSTAPSFTLLTDTMGFIKINDWTGNVTSDGYSRPFFADSDDDGFPELLLGSIEGFVEVYEFTGMAPTDTFSYAGNLANHDFGSYSHIAVTDIDSNDVLDFFVGGFRGGIQHAVGEFVVGREDVLPEFTARIKVFPNPTSGDVTIQLKDATGFNHRRISLLNLMGQQVYTSTMPGKSHRIDVSEFTSGIYFLNVTGDNGKLTEKIVILD